MSLKVMHFFYHHCMYIETIMLYHMVTFPMTLTDSKPGFQDHSILRSRISQKRYVLGTKLLKNTNRKPYTMYRMREERGGAYRGGRPPTACLKRVTDILSCRFIELHYVGWNNSSHPSWIAYAYYISLADVRSFTFVLSWVLAKWYLQF